MAAGPDIILGVASAADSVKQKEALSRLQRLSRQADAVADAGARADVPSTAWDTQIRNAGADTVRASQSAPSTRAAAASDKKSDVYIQFEAVLLQNMVEAMMPSDTEALMGSGTAGQVWKSMLAEKIAAEIARSGVLGIAKQVAAGEAAATAATAPTRPKGTEV